MKIRNVLAFLLMAALLAFVAACDDNGDDDSGVAPEMGFVAEDGDFANYDSWTRVEYAIAPANQNELGGFAHGATDTSVVRDVFTNNADGYSGGEWGEGTIFFKETHGFNGTTPDFANGTYLAMAKRGADFDPNNGDWEYFMLDASASIMNRSGDNPDDFAGCIGCHASAQTDFIFEHPSSYMLEFDTDQEYIDFVTAAMDEWEELETLNGPDPALGAAHGGGDPFRTIYRWQPGGVYKDGIFPTGTIIAKRVFVVEDNVEVEPEGAWTAMVKKDMDSWQWLRLDTVNGVVMVNTDTDNVDAGCTSCHAQRQGMGNGDWAFLHDGLGN
ncbi:cytochrome P460 family protein [bacterium]|nr:cytochrome P460 family protein [bacterium]